MIAGHITLEDITINFVVKDDGTATYTACEGLGGEQESRTVSAPAFLAALGIALHHDGDPNADRDYPAAEEVQPKSRNLRFIP